MSAFADAPRAGSAEAKNGNAPSAVTYNGCTPCRQRRGKEGLEKSKLFKMLDAPRAGSAEAKPSRI